MARAYSQDLRDRVIDSGTSAREAADLRLDAIAAPMDHSPIIDNHTMSRRQPAVERQSV